MPTPAVDMDLQTFPGDVGHAAPYTRLTLFVLALGDVLHAGEIVLVCPGVNRIVKVRLIKQIPVVIEG